jgi:hypothetical protein
MHIKKRGAKALLYRSTWVPKGAEGNTHGFARQVYVGSVPLMATEIPPATCSKLTPPERAFVERQVVQPAKQALARAQHEAHKRSRDPLWRLSEGLRLIREAAVLSAEAGVPSASVGELHKALSTIHVLGAARLAEPDPLENALSALRKAARAVAAGHYGAAPPEGVRKSPVYARWLEIAGQVDGSASDGLLRELQARAWVKVKTR